MFDVLHHRRQLGAVARQRAAVHAAQHAAVDAVLQVADAAVARRGARVAARGGEQRERARCGAAVQVARRAGESCPGVTHGGVGCVGAHELGRLAQQAAAVVDDGVERRLGLRLRCGRARGRRRLRRGLLPHERQHAEEPCCEARRPQRSPWRRCLHRWQCRPGSHLLLSRSARRMTILGTQYHARSGS
jgi:hypothetical protein